MGIRYIRWSHNVSGSSLLATSTINFFNFVFWALFIFYATKELGVKAGALGLVLGAGAVGGVLGAVFASRIAGRIGVGPAFVLGSALFPAPLVLVPLAGGPRPVVLGGTVPGRVRLRLRRDGARHQHQPRSRWCWSLTGCAPASPGAYMVVNYGVRPIGPLVGGLLGAWIGLRTTLWIGWAGALAGALWLLPSPLMRLRGFPEMEA